MCLRQSAIKNRDTKYALAKYLALHHTDKVGDLDVTIRFSETQRLSLSTILTVHHGLDASLLQAELTVPKGLRDPTAAE